MELALATDLYEKHKGLEVRLTLDGLKVIVRLDFSEKYSLEIECGDTSDILYEIEEDREINSVEELAKAIKKMRNTLDKLQYHKLLGRYVPNDDKGQVLIYKVFKKFLDVEDCSNCFEETNMMTVCKHYCCHRCMERIKVCPICRNNLYD